MDSKIPALEYMINRFTEWFTDVSGNDNYKHFSKLKVLKLLFFVSAINAKEGDEGLLDVFDNFVAMPFGPVESDIYNQMNIAKIGKYNITDKGMEIDSNANFLSLDSVTKQMIDSSIDMLKEVNPRLICYSAFNLVDLSHKWSCWQVTMDFAQMLNKGSFRIPSQLIIDSDKYFNL